MIHSMVLLCGMCVGAGEESVPRHINRDPISSFYLPGGVKFDPSRHRIVGGQLVEQNPNYGSFSREPARTLDMGQYHKGIPNHAEQVSRYNTARERNDAMIAAMRERWVRHQIQTQIVNKMEFKID